MTERAEALLDTRRRPDERPTPTRTAARETPPSRFAPPRRAPILASPRLDTATVTVLIEGVPQNLAPAHFDLSASAVAGSAIVVAPGVTDPDGDRITVSLDPVPSPVFGTVADNGDGTFVYAAATSSIGRMGPAEAGALAARFGIASQYERRVGRAGVPSGWKRDEHGDKPLVARPAGIRCPSVVLRRSRRDLRGESFGHAPTLDLDRVRSACAAAHLGVNSGANVACAEGGPVP